MNRLTIIGNLTGDPEVRQVSTRDGSVNVCDFSVAVNDRRKKDANGQPEATFFRCTAWRGLAEVVGKFASKGTKVAVTGPVSCRTYQCNDGQTRASLEVTVDDFEFVGGGQRNNPAGQQADVPQNSAPIPQNDTPIPQSFTPVDNSDLPF